MDGKNECAIVGICWEDYKNIDIDSYLGSDDNKKSFGYNLCTGEKVENEIYTDYGDKLLHE